MSALRDGTGFEVGGGASSARASDGHRRISPPPPFTHPPCRVVAHDDYSRIGTRPINRVVSQRDTLSKWLNAEVGNSIGIDARMLPRRVTDAAVPTTPAELMEQYSSQSRGGSKGSLVSKPTDEDSSQSHRSGVSSLSSKR